MSKVYRGAIDDLARAIWHEPGEQGDTVQICLRRDGSQGVVGVETVIYCECQNCMYNYYGECQRITIILSPSGKCRCYHERLNKEVIG